MNALARHWDVIKIALADEKARAKGLVKVEQNDFLPAALEIVERPVSPTARATAWAMLILLVLTLLWLTFGRIDIVASAPGRLIPAENVKLVQPAEAGIVRAILVHDGEDYALVDVRVDDHPDPLAELARLLDVNDARFAHYRRFMPSRANPSGIVGREELERRIAASLAGRA